MKLDAIKATGIELTEAITAAVDHTLGRLSKLTDRFGEAVSVHVEVGKSTNHHKKGPFFRAEINIRVPKRLIRAEAEHEDLYAAIEKVEDELKGELKKEKEKYLDQRKGSAKE